MRRKKEKKAMFSQRLGAYVLDAIIIGLLSSVITGFIPLSNNAEKLYEEQSTIMENYVEQKISAENYVNKTIDITYDIAKETVLITIVTIILSLIYYVIYPCYHNGQTVGKQVLKIKVKKIDGELTMNDMLFRSMINHSIFINIVSVFIVIFASKDIYLSSTTILEFIQMLIIFISFILVAFTKERQGLHDKLVHTDVVCVEPIKVEEKENVICES